MMNTTNTAAEKNIARFARTAARLMKKERARYGAHVAALYELRAIAEVERMRAEARQG